jgi:branched-chain amino acid transport system substrate-binding protein
MPRHPLSIALCAMLGFVGTTSIARAEKVVIGDIDDMSGVYADIIGQGGIEAAQMAIADFGDEVLGQKIEFRSFDHQKQTRRGLGEVP